MQARQEVANVVLAELLQERGLVSAPETILKARNQSISLPDVIVDFRGLRLAIECEHAKKPKGAARTAAYEKARERVETALAHIGAAVVYPAKIRSVEFSQLKEQLAHCELEYAIISEAAVTQVSDQLYFFPVESNGGFDKGTVDDLAAALRRSYEQLVRDETLNRAVELLNQSIEICLYALKIEPATSVRMGQVLGIDGLSVATTKIATRQRSAVNRIAALILVNAMILQEVLCQSESRVKPLRQLASGPHLVGQIRDHWQFILNEINYYPIFHSATQLIGCLSADPDVSKAIFGLVRAALEVVGWRASLRHDLAGRIYHRILEEAKYLGAYYTSIPSAALLLKLALNPDRSNVEWDDLNTLSDFRIADLACGTGTLLMASADAVLDNHVRRCAEKGVPPKLAELHHVLVEQMIYGYDVLPSAVHLTASTLALRVPDAPINATHLYRVLHGGNERFLGTLECLQPEGATATLFSRPEQVGGSGSVYAAHINLPQLNLCVMNPPFTSSRKGNKLFGSVPDSERKDMQRKLRRLVASTGLSANVTAGLGAVFVGLGDRQLKEGGRMALVLPRSVASGVSWGPTRELFAKKYHLEYLIVCHEPKHWNFSENTDLSEAMVVGRKLRAGESADKAATVCVNLWRQPRNAIEALSVGRSILASDPPSIETTESTLRLEIDKKKYGEAFSIRWKSLQSFPWSLACSFAQTALIRSFFFMMKGGLYVPGVGVSGKIPLCRLQELGELGPDPRDVYDGFKYEIKDKTSYASLWGHDAKRLTKLKTSPNFYLEPLATALPGRNLRDTTLLWPRASRLLLAMRIRLNTKRLVAVRVSQKVLSDVWWPLSLHKGQVDINKAEKALALWFNSTPALLILLGHREETQGAWVQFKKPVLYDMPTLDVRNLDEPLLQRLAESFDSLSNSPLELLPKLATDPTRRAIDQAISESLGLPDFSDLREILGREPFLTQSSADLSL